MTDLTCEPLNECTADDLTPIDEQLRADAIETPATIERLRREEEAAAERALLAVRSRVEALELEAGEAGDWDEVALCRLALGADLADETIGGQPGDLVLSRPWTRAEAVRHVTAQLSG
jgi:hypothetical protein